MEMEEDRVSSVKREVTADSSSAIEPCEEIKTEPEFVYVEEVDAKYVCPSSIKVEQNPGDPLSCSKGYGEESVGEGYREQSTAVEKDPEIPFVSCGELTDEIKEEEVDQGRIFSPGDIIPASGEGVSSSRTLDSTATEKKTFACSVCESVFSRPYDLKVHRRMHSGEKPFACTMCESTFTTASHLRRHVKSHSGRKPYKCVECDKNFTEQSSLRVHMKRHSGEKPFACPECPRTFCRQNDLKIHLRTHTGERPFSCSICRNAFSQSSNLKEHMKTHTGERPYSCTLCANTYIRSTDLKVHMRTHSGERPYTCSECARTFTSSCYLLRHKKIHVAKSYHGGFCESGVTHA
ncbi:gastrula zinc finger protein XlCGF17.1-like [Palaemon carinicauda]|uniref:gastrula zinc finger protein XlCGF17.1-like n=1 Tax=Palaemon carinicauda TaxID=392227 RepID=UPI0035B66C7B